jgi:hypothetical protein
LYADVWAVILNTLLMANVQYINNLFFIRPKFDKTLFYKHIKHYATKILILSNYE